MNLPILSFDTETTSAKPETCRVCQVGAILVHPDGTRETIVDEICDPGMDSCDEATAIHGIGPEQWAGKRSDTEALGDVYRYIEQNLRVNGQPQFVVVGHNVNWFDLPILWRVAEGAPIFGLPVIDTMTCAQRIYPLAPSHRLTTSAKDPEKTGLVEWLQLGAVENAHSAAGDAIMVSRLVKHFMDGLGKTALELATWCSEPRILKTCHFGKHKGKPWGKGEGCVPPFMARWIADNFSPAPDLEATILHHYGYRFKQRSGLV